MTFGGFTVSMGPPPEYEYHPAKGWIYTFGLNGMKTWFEPVYGDLKNIYHLFGGKYLGATGFTGIKISPLGSGFYLGSALRVKLGSSPP